MNSGLLLLYRSVYHRCTMHQASFASRVLFHPMSFSTDRQSLKTWSWRKTSSLGSRLWVRGEDLEQRLKVKKINHDSTPEVSSFKWFNGLLWEKNWFWPSACVSSCCLPLDQYPILPVSPPKRGPPILRDLNGTPRLKPWYCILYKELLASTRCISDIVVGWCWKIIWSYDIILIMWFSRIITMENYSFKITKYYPITITIWISYLNYW